MIESNNKSSVESSAMMDCTTTCSIKTIDEECSNWSAPPAENNPHLLEDPSPMPKRVKAIPFAEPKDKQSTTSQRRGKASMSTWDETKLAEFPMAIESKLMTRTDGESFDVLERIDGLCFVRHAKIHRTLLGWIESCSVAIKDPISNLISPGTLRGHSRVALKMFDLRRVAESEHKEDAFQELVSNARLSRIVGEEHVSPMLSCFRTKELVIAVFPMYSKGDLFEYLSSKDHPLEETEIRRLLIGAASALRTCHSLNICHRDVSLENFCLDERLFPVLIDFGVATEMNPNGLVEHTGPVGKAKYMAPELYASTSSTLVDGAKCDVFSLGVVLLLLAIQMEPWDAACETDPRFRAMVIHGELENVLLLWGFTLSPSLLDLIKRMLCVDPNNRLSMEGVLCHPWVLNVSSDHLLMRPSAG